MRSRSGREVFPEIPNSTLQQGGEVVRFMARFLDRGWHRWGGWEGAVHWWQFLGLLRVQRELPWLPQVWTLQGCGGTWNSSAGICRDVGHDRRHIQSSWVLETNLTPNWNCISSFALPVLFYSRSWPGWTAAEMINNCKAAAQHPWETQQVWASNQHAFMPTIN